ncbi:hypothetical protein BD324DRAFT_630928 [Kockovaella imperatae]|uniref:CCZ1/INTU/HSP4 first Longin domain-containing protein n=1 Tax=Kockovaella imperatae TaxID=4999 RepID=A0A1Y1UC62_9TREE|nr:hypothetical protein BD324DRAFT_630928 [Kockovaella imperatae]ORX35638.1 hypothetical protein BD324DRAFT_630928 [Kockovaella imperatae]
MVPPPAPPRPPSLAHFAIFDPSKADQKPKSEKVDKGKGKERQVDLGDGTDHDDQQPSAREIELQDDLREASQILFYTAKSGSVSRDTMLKQIGLVRGLMGFTEMATGVKDPDESDFWSFRSHRSRMIVYTPKPQIYIYANITLATRVSFETSKAAKNDPKPGSETYEPAPTAQGLSDRLLLQGLKRGFAEYELLYGTYETDSTSSSAFEKFWTSFTFEYEASYVSPSHPLSRALPGIECLPQPQKIQRALLALSNTSALPLTNLGIISTLGTCTLESCPGTLLRYLIKILSMSLSNPHTRSIPSSPASIKTVGDRKSSWSGLGTLSWVPGLGGSRSTTPSRLTASPSKPLDTDSPSRSSLRSVSRSEGPPGSSGEIDRTADKWGFMGLAGLTDAVGSLKVAPSLDMGSLFRFGGGQEHATETTKAGAKTSVVTSSSSRASTFDEPPRADAPDPKDSESSSLSPIETPIRASLEVRPRPDLLPDLEAASTHEIDLGWEFRSVYLDLTTEERAGADPTSKNHCRQTVWWIIRDGILLFALTSPDESPSISSEAVSTFYASLGDLARSGVSGGGAADSSHFDTPWLYAGPESISSSTPGLPTSSENVLLKLEDWSNFEPTIEEISAKTSKEFVSLKRFDKGEETTKKTVFLSLDKKDASLTDVDHAVRGFTRSHPDLVN